MEEECLSSSCSSEGPEVVGALAAKQMHPESQSYSMKAVHGISCL